MSLFQVAIVRVNEKDRQAQRRGSMFDLSLNDNDGGGNGLPTLLPTGRPLNNPVVVNNKKIK